MKKAFSALISLLLLVSMVSTAFATPFTLETAGVTIEVPEGMTGVDKSDENNYALAITVDQDPALTYAYILTYIDAFEGKQLEDLTKEEGDQLVQGVASALESPTFGTAQTDTYPLLLAANGDGTQLHYVSLLNGWLCDVVAGKSDGVALTEDETKVAAQLLTSIQFSEDGASSTEQPSK